MCNRNYGDFGDLEGFHISNWLDILFYLPWWDTCISLLGKIHGKVSRSKNIKFSTYLRLFLLEIFSMGYPFHWIDLKWMDLRNRYRQSGWLCTRWGEITQSLNFKYLYKSHCKSNELLWAFEGYPII